MVDNLNDCGDFAHVWSFGVDDETAKFDQSPVTGRDLCVSHGVGGGRVCKEIVRIQFPADGVE